MSSSSLPLILLLLFLSISLHACTPRPLTEKDTANYLMYKNEREHAQSMLGPARHHVEETMVTNANDANSDYIAEMDYAQPQRKPPIHNEKP